MFLVVVVPTLRLATIGYGAAAALLKRPRRYRTSGPCRRVYQLSPQAGPDAHRDGSVDPDPPRPLSDLDRRRTLPHRAVVMACFPAGCLGHAKLNSPESAHTYECELLQYPAGAVRRAPKETMGLTKVP